MKVLWLSPSDMLTEFMIGSLDSLNEHEVTVCRFDKVGTPPDQGMILASQLDHYDAILYISTSGGPFLAQAETFKAIKSNTPIVHLCFDASDSPWWPLLEEYETKDCFSLTVNCDGCKDWPVGRKGLTLFCPVDPRPYQPRPLSERRIRFGWCGGYGGGFRQEMVQFLTSTNPPLLTVKPRDERYGSYAEYARFMCDTKIALNMAFSGSGHSKQFKARCIEAGFAGCLLLEQEGSATADWLVPGIDYAIYRSKEDAWSAVNWLSNLPDSQRIADNLRRKVWANHSPQVFWKQVFERLT